MTREEKIEFLFQSGWDRDALYRLSETEIDILVFNECHYITDFI